jgi:hypothetical protein
MGDPSASDFMWNMGFNQAAITASIVGFLGACRFEIHVPKQGLLVAEVVGDQCGVHTCQRGDIPDRHMVVPPAGEQFLGSGNQPVACAFIMRSRGDRHGRRGLADGAYRW